MDKIDSVSIVCSRNSCSGCLNHKTRKRLVEDFLGRPSLQQYQQTAVAFLDRIHTKGVSHDVASSKSQREKWPFIDAQLQCAFLDFVKAEVQASGKTEKELVAPSGSLEAPIHLRAHCPSFQSCTRNYGESADRSNPSIGVLFDKGLSFGTGTLLSEASYRREAVVRPGTTSTRARFPEEYAIALRRVHSDFATWVWDHAQAGVIVLLGQANIDRFKKEFPFAVPIPLCEQFDIVNTSFGDAYLLFDDRHEIKHIVLSAYHPEHIIRNMDYNSALYEDYLLNLAAALGNSPDHILEHFFAAKKRQFLIKACHQGGGDVQVLTKLLDLLDLNFQGHRITLDDLPSSVQLQLQAADFEVDRSKIPAWRLNILLRQFCSLPVEGFTDPEWEAEAGRRRRQNYWQSQDARVPSSQRTCMDKDCQKKRDQGTGGLCRRHWKILHPGQRLHPCAEKGCTLERHPQADGFCKPHWKKHHNDQALNPCKEEHCDKERHWKGNGFCKLHWRAHNPGKPIDGCKEQDCKSEKQPKTDGYCLLHWKAKHEGHALKSCKIENCKTEKHFAGDGYCVKHWKEVNPNKAITPCRFGECTSERHSGAEGYCTKHWRELHPTLIPSWYQ